MRAEIRDRLTSLLGRFRRFQLSPETLASLLEAGPDATTIEIGRAPGTIDVRHGGRSAGAVNQPLLAFGTVAKRD